MKRLRLLAPCVFVFASACGVPSDGERIDSRASAILAGTRSTNAAVVAIVNPAELCSAFLVAPNVVLTARHCVSEIGGSGCTAMATHDYAASELQVWPQTVTPTSGTAFLSVAEVVLPPSDGTLCGNDVALLRLTAPIDNAMTLAPRLDGPPVEGEPLTVVGYGQTAGNPTSAGVRRESSDAHVDTVGATSAGGVQRTTDDEWVIDQGPCFGDSGSPALGGDGLVVGVMSRGSGNTCLAMVYERIDTRAAWLRDATIAATAAGGIAAPAWTAPTTADAGADDAGTDASVANDAGETIHHSGCTVRPGTSRERSRDGEWLGIAFGVIAALEASRRRRRRE